MSAFVARAATLADLPVVCSWVDDADTLFYLHPRAQFPLTVAQLAEAFAARALNTVLLADGAPSLRLSQEALASAVGLSRQSCNAMLGQLAELGLIQLGRGVITVRDAAGLARESEG